MLQINSQEITNLLQSGLILISIYQLSQLRLLVNLHFFINQIEHRQVHMGCTYVKKANALDASNRTEYLDAISKISPEEINILRMIYFDLALRNGNKKIEKQTFYVFFQKNGLWGNRLFKQFDLDNSGFVCLQQFILSTAKIIKADQDSKIGLLYEFFAFGNTDIHDGIIYADFLRVLYNYSRQQLKKMLQLYYLNQAQLKQELIDVLKTFERGSPNHQKSNNDSICVEMKDKQDSVYGSNTYHLLNMPKLDKRKHLFNSFIGKPALKHVESDVRKSDTSKNPQSDQKNRYSDPKNQGQDTRNLQSDNKNHQCNSDKQFQNLSTSLIYKNNQNVHKDSGLMFQLNDKKITIKTSSYHALVKKLAGLIFSHFQIDKKQGRLSEEQFIEWIKQHKDLYESYYRGFNQHIWEMKSGKLGYINQVSDIQSQARYMGQIFQNGGFTQKCMVRNCKVFLQGSILFACDQNNKEMLYSIICLQGLQVNRVHEYKFGYGIQIKQKHNIYPKKNIFFKNEVTCQKWMEHLKDYKGFNVHEKYQLGMRIGAGKYSIVFVCKERQNNKRYAMKQIDTFRLSNQEKSIISHESNIMCALDHVNLLKYRQAIKAKNKIYIITELVEGKDLMQLVKQKQVLNEFQASKIARQIIQGIKYLHGLGIVHRDLKPENIMIQSKGSGTLQVKIIDFGFANYIKNLQFLNDQDAIVGTPNYIAPEVYKKQPITEKVDIFSIGTILYFMLSGDLPFNSENLQFLIQRTLSEKCQFVGKKWMRVSKQAKQLIERLLQVDPDKRISLKEALHHDWFRISSSPAQEALNTRQQRHASLGLKKLYLY